MISFRDEDIEAPSGKGAADENFPVGSFLIAPPLRPHVVAYYEFARAADDIGDDDALSPEEKVRRLDAFGAVLRGEAEGLSRPEALRRTFAERNIVPERGLDLLSAFRQDAVKTRYESFSELEDYCRRSANPVGRFLLDLHGEDGALYPASDALCTSLQILNHLQDAEDDLRAVGRCYLPQDWIRAEGASTDDLRGAKLSPGLRRVYDRLLDHCRKLNERAEALVGGLRSRRLAAESAVIIRLAKRLQKRLRTDDAIASRVALSKADFARAGTLGLWDGAFPRRRAA